ncbi:MAG: ChaN family lipoprotein [Flavobacteriales bacterium]|jgi:uncharacterized iron-regulated protein|nr:ChaN family lipoprotein [Flavobacteriales bacterium]MBT3963939.1 ChaN family lipoprotein [Flavobacteriales bacterium]MBT4704046.1 ChaN family lipoprotein [Flavobacteriales bacterium]MBT4930258.1 ChaN family lipoprotein [Flavobacteriales bacterium]MBT5132481.1 ChaN family lipoprotein [Flavobacteriales bacterium]
MRIAILILGLVVQFHHGYSQSLEAYRLFNQQGEEITFARLSEELQSSDVVLFGEQHNNPICHWLQLELSKELNEKRGLVFGAEMFESDDQLVLNEYLGGDISYDRLKEEAKLWSNYKTDYAPLVDYARDNQIKFIATNIPKRYASMVSTRGQGALTNLDKEAKKFFPKMPFEVTANDKGYAEMKKMMGGHGHGGAMDIDKLIEAQASKDYTMAHFILENHDKGELFLHFNGAYHSKLDGGIVGYLRAAKKRLEVSVITSLTVDELEFKEEYSDQGDYILLIPNSMTKTY